MAFKESLAQNISIYPTSSQAHGYQNDSTHRPQRDNRHQHVPRWLHRLPTSMWLSAAAKPTDINMESWSSRDHKHLHSPDGNKGHGHQYDPQLHQDRGPRQGLQQQPGLQISIWPQVAAQAAHINMDLGISMAHRYHYGFGQWHRPWTSTWISAVTWVSDINTAFDCNMSKDLNTVFSNSMEHKLQHGFKWKHILGTSTWTLGFIMAWGRSTDHPYQHGLWQSMYSEGLSRSSNAEK